MKAAIPLDQLTEKQWQTQVIQLARALAWKRPYHVFDSRRTEPGWPDLVLVRDRIVYLELKREAGKLTGPQREWLRALRAAGGEAYIARPRDLQPLAQVLQERHRPADSVLERLTRAELRESEEKAALCA